MVGKMAYELELPAELAAVHPVFHISLLKKCVGDPASIVSLESASGPKVEKQSSRFCQGFVEKSVRRGSYLGS